MDEGTRSLNRASSLGSGARRGPVDFHDCWVRWHDLGIEPALIELDKAVTLGGRVYLIVEVDKKRERARVRQP